MKIKVELYVAGQIFNEIVRAVDYEEARKSEVFLEPIVLPKDFREELGAD